MLAVEPHLAGLPWQHLFAFSQGQSQHEINRLLVTIIPNLGWASVVTRTRPSQLFFRYPKYRLCQSNDREIELARRQLNYFDTKTWPAFDISVVLGHGYWPKNSGEHPQIIVGNKPLSVKDWCDLASREVLVLHSCWSGTSADASPWADGILTVHLLGGDCRAVVAPVGRAPVEAMAALHQKLSEPMPDETLGTCYLRALAIEPSVSLYTLFGLGIAQPRPNEDRQNRISEQAPPTHLRLVDDQRKRSRINLE